jgi:hypothetical protein
MPGGWPTRPAVFRESCTQQPAAQLKGYFENSAEDCVLSLVRSHRNGKDGFREKLSMFSALSTSVSVFHQCLL